MNRAARWLAIVPVVGASVALAAQAIDAGVVRTVVQDEVSAPAPEAMLEQRYAEALRAAEVSPRDPAAHELVGIIGARRGAPEYLREALVHLSTAARLRPTSPYTWANIASVDYRLGETGAPFRAALLRAAQLGPYEPEVQRTITDLGLAVWDEMPGQIQNAIEMRVAAAMKRNAAETLQIAKRRGRLDVPCRHLAGIPRQTDSKWTNLCQSMEATS